MLSTQERFSEDVKAQISTVYECFQSIYQSIEDNSTGLNFVVLDPEKIHIRVYSDASFKNFCTNQSQLGFLLMFCDKNDNDNIIHWNSFRATRHSHSTEQTELLDLAALLPA